ncbi:hypothetical protein HY218_01185 [Candidatus Saccharibacteria bacterium]|nr:hypothetical protein [Candidatus Saccharibacteria bacterium]
MSKRPTSERISRVQQAREAEAARLKSTAGRVYSDLRSIAYPNEICNRSCHAFDIGFHAIHDQLVDRQITSRQAKELASQLGSVLCNGVAELSDFRSEAGGRGEPIIMQCVAEDVIAKNTRQRL